MDTFSFAKNRSLELTSKNQSHSFSRSNTAEYGSLIWTFDANNHYLHPKLVKIVYSKAARWAMAIIIIPMMFLSMLPKYVQYIYWLVVLPLVMIPFLLLTTLSFNRDASGFIVKSSEFWIKIIYSFAKAILQLLRYHLVLRQAESNQVTGSLGYASSSLGIINETLVMVAVGGVDAIPKMTHKWKAILMGLAAAYYTIEAISFQFLEPRKLDYVMTIETTGSEVSLNTLISNAAGMMAMFLWKQTIDVIRNKNRCICITYRPYLQWTGSTTDSGLINGNQMPKSVEIIKSDIDTGDSLQARPRGFSILNS